jgi:hypothetical protein
MATGRIGSTPVLRVRWSDQPTAGTTVLSGLDDNSVALVYDAGYEAVYRNGVLLSRGNDYTATDGTTVTLIDATLAGDIIEIFANDLVPLTDAISKGQFTAKGALLSATAASTPGVLPVGSNAQVLTADSTASTGLAWATPAAAGGMTLLSTTTLSGASTTISSISQSYKDLICIFRGAATNGSDFSIRTNGITTASYYGISTTIDSATPSNVFRTAQTSMMTKDAPNTSTNNTGYLKIYDYAGTSAAYKYCEFAYFDTPANRLLQMEFVNQGVTSAGITSITFLSAGSSSGTVLLYGVS